MSPICGAVPYESRNRCRTPLRGIVFRWTAPRGTVPLLDRLSAGPPLRRTAFRVTCFCARSVSEVHKWHPKMDTIREQQQFLRKLQRCTMSADQFATMFLHVTQEVRICFRGTGRVTSTVMEEAPLHALIFCAREACILAVVGRVHVTRSTTMMAAPRWVAKLSPLPFPTVGARCATAGAQAVRSQRQVLRALLQCRRDSPKSVGACTV